MVWPAVIAAGAAVAGSLLARGGGVSKTMTGYYREEDRRERAKAYRISVNDAKRAGLHPLFALGSSANYAPTGFVGTPGQSTGSAAGEGIARAGSEIASGMREAKREGRTAKLDAASQQIHNLRLQKMTREIQLDDAQLMKMASDRKMAEQRHLYWGTPGDLSTGSPESITYPYGVERGPALEQRPLTATGRQSHPETVESVSPDGTRMALLNPDLGLDEVGQAEYLRLKAIGWTVKKLHAWAARRRKIQQQRRRRVRRSDPQFYGGS